MAKMIPVGYLAKRVVPKPACFKATQIEDIYSVSSCVNDDFADYTRYWKHNNYWLFDSARTIRELAAEHALPLDGTSLFYYEAYELEFDSRSWRSFAAEPGLPTCIVEPAQKKLEGFDVVTFWARNAPECSPLSCNHLADEIPTNSHCLFATFDDAQAALNAGLFENCEPGPYRIFAVYSVDWP